MKTTAMAALVAACAGLAVAQTGPTASVSSVDFTYTANTPASLKLKAGAKNPFTVTLPSSMSSQTMVVSVASNPQGWFAVTPATGSTPLTLTVTVNPTTLDPGNHSGIITIDTLAGSGNPAIVTVTIAISNPPSAIKVSSADNTASGAVALGFSYVTDAPTPTPLGLDISSTGDVIPFTVTAVSSLGGTAGGKSSGWLRVNQNNLPPLLTTSGVALSGSVMQVFVSIDAAALGLLDPKLSPFAGTITITPSTGTPVTVTVTLQVLAGKPTLRSIFPASVPAAPVNDPVITLYGTNFFQSTNVTIAQAGLPMPPKSTTCIDRTVMQIAIGSTFLTAAGTWTITVYNVGQPAVSTTLTVTDPTVPIITSVVNSASFLPSAVQVVGANPVATGSTSVSPREIVSIFGRNLGPLTLASVAPEGTPPAYPVANGGVMVEFLVSNGTTVTPYHAPLIMISSTQINCVVPREAYGSAGPVTVSVSNGGVLTPEFPVTVVLDDPAIFTIGGVGQGQAAVLNFDSATGTFTVNSTAAKAGKNTAISIFATGLGDLASALGNGDVSPSNPINLAATAAEVRVEIGGQPAVVTYAGTSPGAVAGLVQINSFVPLSAGSGVQPITVGVAKGTTWLRRSPPGVTINVK